ncbi:AAA family ATPase [Roseobacter sp. YSTF-M11]|uniref:endopeptidase La n=1 Tax=Roseobacter insulae TaxID=2859783 RepID=A0A9X1FRE6_9RHOB|nr:ATP-binding protein [Roseobacter insulae]MBW4706196.1 AAA family ATPase [Roseobacter insulae]
MANTEKRDASLPGGLSAAKLRLEIQPELLGFETTADLKPVAGLVGQDRAIEAIRLSASIGDKDFNLFVAGREGMGRHTAVSTLLEQEATRRPTPADWVYVNNFDTPHKPNAIKLPAGQAPVLRKGMEDLVDDLANDIPALFDSDEYQTQRRAIEQEAGERQERPIAAFAEQVKEENVALLKTPMGFMLAAVVDGKPIKPDDYAELEPAERQAIDEKIERLQTQLAAILKEGPQLEKEHRQKVEKLHADMAERVVSVRVQALADDYTGNPEVTSYLAAVRRDIISNAELFLENVDDDNNGPFPTAIHKYHREPRFYQYGVNVMVSQAHAKRAAAPVIFEDKPSLNQLTGRIEHLSQMGTLVTNFTLIKPGALHRANGGYLVLDARRLLAEPYAWDALKRCLQSQSIAIISLADRLSLGSTISLEPDPIPCDVRVVLIGDRRLHMLLVMLDPEFGTLFKLFADFEDDLPRTAKNTRQLAEVVAAYAARENLCVMTAAAVAALLDHAVRLADDTRKLTLQLGVLGDIMREADHYARQAGRTVMQADDINHAVERADYRAGRIKNRMQEAVVRKTVLIDTAGHAVGQVNGLSVIGIGTHRFGRPSRITARVRLGAGKLVDIEREVELGGPIHSKGVLILSGYLSSIYALDVPMSLHASLVFEQSYGGVEGDSASAAELFALLSALSGIPIRQGLAVTGSVNQRGEIQAIGGVNEKIEGFFDICKARRLTGDQGVLIPVSNVDNLMLRQDVVEAARAGKFRVIPIRSIDEGIEILTGKPAGKRRRNTVFPTGTVNALVEDRLRAFAQKRRQFAEAPPDKTAQGGAS